MLFSKSTRCNNSFDVTNQKTFSDLQYWIESMNSHLYDDIDSIPVIIIGNKIDLPKRIVIKVGTSTLTSDTGKTNIRRLSKLVSVISDLVNFFC